MTAIPELTWDRVMAINVKGVFLGCRLGVPAILEGRGGSIVNVASFVAVDGLGDTADRVPDATFVLDGGVTAAFVTPEWPPGRPRRRGG